MCNNDEGMRGFMEIGNELKVNTPIMDFIGNYSEKGNSRFHMPGHKGKAHLGFEEYDITEINGADNLYHADGIIAKSEAIASKLFGSDRSFYSTEGSSQCIKAMLKIVMDEYKGDKKPYIIAARNVHKAFIYGVALLDMDVRFIYEEGSSFCSDVIDSKVLEDILSKADYLPAAVYITSPDYLGKISDVKALAKACHKFNVPLIVDNAHGAYLHFLEDKIHPMDLGADMCCDSAHKTLPVLTGGAYLHLADSYKEVDDEAVKEAMSLFGSTSPSYLTLISLDKCNEYLAKDYQSELTDTLKRIGAIKNKYKELLLDNTEDLKITVKLDGRDKDKLENVLKECKIEPEYMDDDYIVFMITPDNTYTDFERLDEALGLIGKLDDNLLNDSLAISKKDIQMAMTIREAIMSAHEIIDIKEAKGRICASPTVSCPPAIPIAISGQIITDKEIDLFQKYNIEKIEVVKQKV